VQRTGAVALHTINDIESRKFEAVECCSFSSAQTAEVKTLWGSGCLMDVVKPNFRKIFARKVSHHIVISCTLFCKGIVTLCTYSSSEKHLINTFWRLLHVHCLCKQYGQWVRKFGQIGTEFLKSIHSFMLGISHSSPMLGPKHRFSES